MCAISMLYRLTTPLALRARALQNTFLNLCYSITVTHTARARQRASALPRAKIESVLFLMQIALQVLLLPSHWFIEAGTHPRAISSLVIPTWMNERRTRSVAVMHLIYESCQSQYKVKRRISLEGREMTRNDSVDCFMCGLIAGVEDLVHFR